MPADRHRHVSQRYSAHKHAQSAGKSFHDTSAAQVPYRAVEVNPLTKAELKWGPHRHVPVALLDQEVLADSSAIVSRLAAEAEAARAAVQRSGARKGWFQRGGARQPSAPQPSPASLGESGLAL